MYRLHRTNPRAHVNIDEEFRGLRPNHSLPLFIEDDLWDILREFHGKEWLRTEIQDWFSSDEELTHSYCTLREAGPDGEDIHYHFEKGEDEEGIFYMALLDSPLT